MKKLILFFASIGLITFSACTDTTTDDGRITEYQMNEAPAADATAKEVSLTINAGDDMKYDKTELKVFEGQKVTITLNHTGTMPKESMGHNLVILKQGVDLAAFGNESLKAKDTDYIPAGSQDVLVHTEMIGGGASTTVTFDAPAKGSYDFICTFPGHFGTMKGKFIVE